MLNRNFIISLFVILLPLQSSTVKADEWDLSKAPIATQTQHLQKWCKNEGSMVRYSNTQVAGYTPCGELKTMVVCDASGKKLISSGRPPYGYKECSETPRILVERIGPPLPEKEPEETMSLAKNAVADPKEQIATGLKTYQDYISSLDQLADEGPSKKKQMPKTDASNLNGLMGQISPAVLTEAMKMISGMSN